MEDNQWSSDAVEYVLQDVQNKRSVALSQSFNSCIIYEISTLPTLPNSIGAMKAMAITGKKKMLIIRDIIPTLADTRFLLRFFISSTAERAIREFRSVTRWLNN